VSDHGGERVMMEGSVEKSSVERIELKCVPYLMQWLKFSFPRWETTRISHTKSHQ